MARTFNIPSARVVRALKARSLLIFVLGLLR
jgi:hypothetical protein